MEFFVERALNPALSRWEAVGATEGSGIGGDAYAVEHLSRAAGIYRARPAAPHDEIPSVFSVDSAGHANRRVTV